MKPQKPLKQRRREVAQDKSRLETSSAVAHHHDPHFRHLAWTSAPKVLKVAFQARGSLQSSDDAIIACEMDLDVSIKQ